MVDLTASATLLLLFLASLVLLSAILSPRPLLRWLQRKRYQYEVTFSLYMLTPTEKFIFNSFLFLFLSMIIIAASLYLPEHLTTIAQRVFYYLAGDDSGPAAAAAAQLKNTAIQSAQKIAPSVKPVMDSTVEAVRRAATEGIKANGRGMMEQ